MSLPPGFESLAPAPAHGIMTEKSEHVDDETIAINRRASTQRLNNVMNTTRLDKADEMIMNKTLNMFRRVSAMGPPEENSSSNGSRPRRRSSTRRQSSMMTTNTVDPMVLLARKQSLALMASRSSATERGGGGKKKKQTLTCASKTSVVVSTKKLSIGSSAAKCFEHNK